MFGIKGMLIVGAIGFAGIAVQEWRVMNLQQYKTNYKAAQHANESNQTSITKLEDRIGQCMADRVADVKASSTALIDQARRSERNTAQQVAREAAHWEELINDEDYQDWALTSVPLSSVERVYQAGSD